MSEIDSDELPDLEEIPIQQTVQKETVFSQNFEPSFAFYQDFYRCVHKGLLQRNQIVKFIDFVCDIFVFKDKTNHEMAEYFLPSQKTPFM